MARWRPSVRKRGPDIPSNPRRLTTDPCNKVNRYDMILLNPEKHPVPKQALAQRFAQWLLSPEGQAAIGGYEVAGERLFHPSAAAPK